MTDELNAPLGRKPPRRRAPPLPARPLLLAGGGLAVAGAAALAFLPTDPHGGEPYAIAGIERAPDPPPPPEAPAQPTATGPHTPPGDDSAGDIEVVAGVKVTRHGEGGSARIIRVPPPLARLAPAPDPRITEKGRYGPLPRVGADGARPMDVYARRVIAGPALKSGAPRLALIIGGVGLDAQSSHHAIEELPQEVTLAFAPYGADLDRLVAQARGRGHEALLQAPMEPFDYPRNNPGPHTLRVGAADGGVDDLLWMMSRFAGYAGVMNYLGGSFTADETALSGAVKEIARRGLFYIDDGLSPQSQAPGVAKKLAAPFAKIDVVLDESGAPQAMDAALARLEALAQEKGVAIGFANAAPAALARVAQFTRDLERRGVALVPVSAVIGRGAAPAASRAP